MINNKKVSIEFTGINTVKITNVYYQKSFNLKEDCEIDLINLTYTKSPDKPLLNLPFEVYFKYNKSSGCFEGLVIYQQQKNKYFFFTEEKDMVSYKNNKKVYSVKIYEED